MVAIGFEGGIVGQPLSGQETAIPGGKQDDAFHTSNLIVQVGGNEAPQQIGSKDNVSEGQPWQNGQNAKLSSEVPKVVFLCIGGVCACNVSVKCQTTCTPFSKNISLAFMEIRRILNWQLF